MLSRRLAVTIAALACLLVGCHPPAPTPTPVPTYQCTPEAGGDPFECTQQQYDEMVAKDKLYAEAEAVYRRFFAEDVRIMRGGGIQEPTDILLGTTSGEFLEDVMSEYREMYRLGMRATGDDPTLKGLFRQPGVSKGGSVVTLKSCVDATRTAYVADGEVKSHGPVALDTVYFAKQGGSLKIIGADGEEVERCGV